MEMVQRAIDYVEERLAEALELEEIGRAAAMSVPNLYRLFYAMTGHPIKEYIRKRRTSEAAMMLRLTDLSAKEIGFRCGFDTYQTFVKTFRRIAGMTPGQYRQADAIYSFERIRLHERLAYCEERAVYERYPEIKVIRLPPLSGVGYLHTAEREEGLEEEACRRFQALLAGSGLDPSRMRLFGWNVEPTAALTGAASFAYQMLAVGPAPAGSQPPSFEEAAEHAALRPIALEGGAYATAWTSVESGQVIQRAWNRLVSEWLPLSSFELGDHGFLEEYQQWNGRIARMKLYLPVRKSKQTDAIHIVRREPVRVITFRAEGDDGGTLADEAAMRWLRLHDSFADSSHRFEVFMSNNLEVTFDGSSVHEIHLSLPEDCVPFGEKDGHAGQLEGGLYACLQTRAFGAMTGVLERIYRWLGESLEYEADPDRQWYTRYLPEEPAAERSIASLEREVVTETYVPIVPRISNRKDE